MTTIASVVEGHGEVQALPVLLRRLAEHVAPEVPIQQPWRLPRGRFGTVALATAVAVSARRVTGPGGILVLLDADDDCPVELAAHVRAAASPERISVPLSVVVADREYEAWFLASCLTVRQHVDVSLDFDFSDDPDGPRDSKYRLERHLTTGKYSETRHQPAFSSLIDVEVASAGSRSFRKLTAEVSSLRGCPRG